MHRYTEERFHIDGLGTAVGPVAFGKLFPECISETETKCEIGRLVSIGRPWLPVVLEMMAHTRLDIYTERRQDIDLDTRSSIDRPQQPLRRNRILVCGSHRIMEVVGRL